jgi:hypothetical protein
MVTLKSISPKVPNRRLTPSKRVHTGETGPTPETLARMAERAGATVYCNTKTRQTHMTGDYKAGSGALEYLFSHKLISQAHVRAGHRYAYYHAVVFGQIAPKQSVALSRWITDDFGNSRGKSARFMTEEDRAEHAQKCRRSYDRGDDALRLRSISREIRQMVRAVCLDGHQPRDKRELAPLLRGLAILAGRWNIRDE